MNVKEAPGSRVLDGLVSLPPAIAEGSGIFLLQWSLLLTVSQLGLFAYGLKFRLIFFSHGGDRLVTSLLTVSPRPEIGFGLFLFTVPAPQVKKTNLK